MYESLLNDRSGSWLPPDPYTQRGYPKDSCHHPFRSVGIAPHAIQPKECRTSFQRHMDTVVHDFDFMFVYLDDIHVASQPKSEHRVHLRQVLECLEQQDLIINLSMCQFGRNFLGHPIAKQGAIPLPSKVAATKEFTKTMTQGTPGVHWNDTFLPASANILQSLSKFSQGSPKNYVGTRKW